jgi:site-specific DNA-methyltransferase (adenine-specific)
MSKTSWNREQLFSSTGIEGSGDWATPSTLFEALDAEFGFDLDACATASNATCDDFISPDEDAMTVDWETRGSTIWVNPPYGRGVLDWVKKAYLTSLRGCTVVVLIFARTDTRWWHLYASRAAEIRFIKGRVHFNRGSAAGPATAPSALLVFSETLRKPVIQHVILPRGD